MRVRAVVAIGLLLLPAGLSAQRIRAPRIGGRGPAQPAPLPPQPAAIARELAYKRLRLSVETYPLISYVQAPGFGDGVVTSWTSFGAGTRADYRLTRYASATLDITSSFLGGPAVTETAELGARFHRQRSESRAYPFVDIRAGYMHAYDSYVTPLDNVYGYPTTQAVGYGARYSHGVGGVGGAGLEYALTRRFSLTTAGSVMRNHMTAYDFRGARPMNRGYWLTSYRYTLGIRYNPVRLITNPGAELP
jgi:hypothetical protein